MDGEEIDAVGPAVLIHTDRLLLRTFRAGDEFQLLSFYSLEVVCRFLPYGPWDLDYAEKAVATRLLRRDINAGAIALVVEHEGNVIGTVEAWMVDERKQIVEIGWVISPDSAGHGYATEAAAAVINLVFESTTVNRIAAQMDGRHSASARLAGRLGMHQEAHFRQNWWVEDEWTDSLVFAILRSDWSAETT